MADEVVEKVETPQPAPEAPKATETVTEPTAKAEPVAKPDNDSIPGHRFREVYRQKKELERQIQELQKPKAEPEKSPSPPKPEDFGDDVAAFNRAFIRHEAEQIANKKLDDYKESQNTQRQTESLNQRRDAAAANWAAKSLDAQSRHADFHQALELAEMSGLVFPPQLSLLIAESDKAGDLAYHLAKNHDVSARLLSLPAERAILELGRIEATLSTGSGKPEAKITKAPAPPTPVGTSSTGSTRFREDMSQAEFDKAFPVIW